MEILTRFSGEVSTKAPRARARMIQWLESNLREAFETEGIDSEIRREWSRLFLGTGNIRALDLLRRIPGVQSFSVVATSPETELESVIRAGQEQCAEEVKGKRFAVRARINRQEAKVDYRSVDLERRLGAALAPYAKQVDLTHPEVTVQVEVRKKSYFFTRSLAGPGGLPIGREGRALVLASGGFDSAVAAWMLLKRGTPVDYLFCNLGGQAHRQEVIRVLKVLSDQWSYGSRPRLFVLDFEPVAMELQARTHPRYWQVLLKRAMYRAAERLAPECGAQAIVTGEALSQVSSQTLQNLETISQAVSMPVFRPLLGFNKDEIIRQAREIGTYQFSAGIQEHCALVPKNPATRARLGRILQEEAQLDGRALEESLENRESLDLRGIKIESLVAPELEIEEIPSDAVVVDLRSASAYEAWHYPGARHVEFFRALEDLHRFDPKATYVLYCEIGLKSGRLAEKMRQAGYRAYNFKGGMAMLARYAEQQQLLVRELLQPANIFE